MEKLDAIERAMTAAERQKAHRERMRIKGKHALHELETAYKKERGYDLANVLIQDIWKSMPGDDEMAEQSMERIWREIGRRKG